MPVEELHALLESEPPFAIMTKGGRSYHITDRKSVWAPEAYKDMFCLAVPGKGIVVLRANAIESIQIEHETAGTR